MISFATSAEKKFISWPHDQPLKHRFNFIFILASSLFFFSTCESNQEIGYNDFVDRLKADEAYIGFFAAEEKCISHVTDAYLKERRKFFLKVSKCKEDPEDRIIQPFIEYCQRNDLLKPDCQEEWEKTLTVLSYELYANMPIFKFETEDVSEHRSIVFAEYPNKNLELDLFIPKDPLDEPMPVVVCIHGGGWRVNRKIWFEPFAKYLASKGMAAVTIDYRKLPAVTVMECIYDSKAAVRWARANASKYNFDPQRIGAIGASAGAHLVALLGTTARVPELEGTGGNQGVSSEVQSVVGLATPAFKKNGDPELVRWLGLAEEQIDLISPYENITENAAPLLLIHGTVDQVVDPQDSHDLYDKYKQVGAHVEVRWIDNQGHGFYEGTDLGIKLASEFFTKQFTQVK